MTEHLDNAPTLLTAGEVAAIFRVDNATVNRWARQGKVRCVRTPSGGQRFDADEIRRLFGEQTGGQP
ncbi:helix-turn-helix domain-containing protein [Nocardiopsis sp. EMB25]|uniref:helix-turn-helix domain-containing protein n=1 Tax=Nocardiopsis sp. EMB25 TaxID=2835867 RepID=UPI0022848B54|nr:helix-turn-helix domain-containing protein [Nocardiopsis sp. EMB25]MCY9785444.1 helix-turn-helix domain-containing protein [Nocardiopsis sp. EMB25]